MMPARPLTVHQPFLSSQAKVPKKAYYVSYVAAERSSAEDLEDEV